MKFVILTLLTMLLSVFEINAQTITEKDLCGVWVAKLFNPHASLEREPKRLMTIKLNANKSAKMLLTSNRQDEGICYDFKQEGTWSYNNNQIEFKWNNKHEIDTINWNRERVSAKEFSREIESAKPILKRYTSLGVKDFHEAIKFYDNINDLDFIYFDIANTVENNLVYVETDADSRSKGFNDYLICREAINFHEFNLLWGHPSNSRTSYQWNSVGDQYNFYAKKIINLFNFITDQNYRLPSERELKYALYGGQFADRGGLGLRHQYVTLQNIRATEFYIQNKTLYCDYYGYSSFIPTNHKDFPLYFAYRLVLDVTPENMQKYAKQRLEKFKCDSIINAFTNNGMVYIHGGKFKMGPTTKEQKKHSYDDNKKSHDVILNSFYVSKNQISAALWRAVMGPYNLSYSKEQKKYIDLSEQLPNEDYPIDSLAMDYVSWNDCQNFINKLNKLTGQNFRLPTEAEWEYLAKGEYCQDAKKNVKSDNSNKLKVNMYHNLMEYCLDVYDPDFYQLSPKSNPVAKGRLGIDNEMKVVRGYNHYISFIVRSSEIANSSSVGGIGFRLVRKPSSEELNDNE